jgi:hypothetical protein
MGLPNNLLATWTEAKLAEATNSKFVVLRGAIPFVATSFMATELKEIMQVMEKQVTKAAVNLEKYRKYRKVTSLLNNRENQEIALKVWEFLKREGHL